MIQTAVLNKHPMPVQPGDAFLRLTVTTLDPTAICNAFDQGKLAYAAHDYSEAIKFYTHALDAVQSDLLSVISLHRAAAYEMGNNYDLALQDSYRANPNNNSPRPDSYFTQAGILLLQNKISEAARVYEKGAECVSKTCSQHQVLVSRRDELLREVGLQNESITHRIPLEVVYKILSYLPMHSRFRLAFTCRYWYNFMLHHWDGLWSIIDATDGYVPKNYQTIYRFLQAISPHHVEEVKLDMSEMPDRTPTLIIGNDSKEQATIDRSQYVVAAILQMNWSNIKSLRIKYLKEEPYYDILEFSKSTLEQLEVRSVDRNDCIALSDAASTCPNLRLITHHITGEHAVPIGPAFSSMQDILLQFNFHLTHLILSNWIRPEALGRLLERSPHLLLLSLNSAHDYNHAEIIYTVYMRCHALQTFSYKSEFNDKLTTKHSRLNDGLPVLHGLKSFEFQISHTAVDSANEINKALGMMLVKNYNTLETLKIDSAFIGLVGVLGPLTLHEPHHLLTLDLNQPFGSVIHVYIFLAACRSLQAVTLRGTFFWNDTILKTLSELPLRELTMLANDEVTPDDLLPPENVMQTAEQALISLVKSVHTLKSLTVNYGSSFNVSDDFLLHLTSAIATKSCVNVLNFQSIVVSDGQMAAILSNLKDSPVRKLSFQKTATASVRALRALGLAIGVENNHAHYADNDLGVVSHKLEEILFSRESRSLVAVKPFITDTLQWDISYHWDGRSVFK